ncbi:ABC transporter permease [Spiroplasma sp. TIUS-1]|uniref:ABC transporter permease subunit n=1 Tax=Spiroplasma sp. TIUS-1 TaxID=216963 RepID=UPI001398D940|nr:ABC transporter permease subunit [Spiroplasma sp. TIUS-1]QHX35701.1 ABC transporter permease [Spiroplasma sp. TIUS-1]
MFSFKIYKNTIKQMWKFWSVITIGVIALTIIMLVMFADKGGSTAQGPEGPMNLYEFVLPQSYFGATGIGYQLPIIFIIIIGNRILAAEVEKGYLSYLLSSPLSRNKIVTSKLLAFISSVLVYSLLTTIVGVITLASTNESGMINFWLVNSLGLGLLLLTAAGISFLFSAIFNKGALSLLVTSTILGVSIIFGMFGMLFEETIPALANLKYISLNILFDTSFIDADKVGTWIGQYLAMIAGSIGLFFGAVIYFKNKDLPL